MEVIFIKKEQFKTIQQIVELEKNLIRGCRNKEEEDYFIYDRLLKQYGKLNIFEIKENKKYNIIYKESKNLGTTKWSRWVKIINWKFGVKFERETECYYVFDNSKIMKNNIKCFIE